ncbi:MAG: extracellular solute-binding protein [Lachnospiraceae bacterium]|nr:extracellular solute-binding protein [Lachnospiraceae bacterium]
MKKRILALVLVLAMCMACLTACGKGKDSEESADIAGTYEITVWVPELAVDLTEKQINDFNSNNEYGVKFDATIEPVSEADSATQMITDVSAGADIFFFAQDQTARLIQAQALTKIGVAAGKTIEDSNEAGAVAAAKSGDSLYAYPLTSDNGFFLYYDKSVIPDSDVTSLEKIIADCEAAGRSFSFELGNAWYNAAFFFGAGCVSEWTTDDDGNFVSINDDYNSDKGLIAAKGIYKTVTSSAYTNSSSGADFEAAIPAGFVITGTWDYQTVSKILGDNMGTAELPSYTVDGKSYHLGSFSGCKLLGVKPQTEAKRAAALAKLATYLTSESAQLERFNELAWGPSNSAAQKSDAVQANPGLKALFAQNQYAKPQGQIHGSWWDIAKAITAGVLESDGSDAALKDVLKLYYDTISALFNMSADEKSSFSVIGAICGTNWDTDLEMICSAELGTQKWYSKDALQLNAGDEFQVRQGKAWDVQFGALGDDGKSTKNNFVVPETGYYFVKLDFDKDAGTGVVSLVKNSYATGWTAIGVLDGSNWDKDFEMEIQADGVTYVSVDEFTLTAGTEFKVRQGHGWDVSYGDGAANYIVGADVKGHIVFDTSTNTVTVK